MSVEDLKAKGNAAYSTGQYSAAIEAYTEAIRVDPTIPALFSNRAMANLYQGDVEKCFEDAQKSITLDVNWWRGHQRLLYGDLAGH